jgi:membrane protein DedA with SNARE-associated domain
VTPFAGVAGLPPARSLVPAALASALWYAFLAAAGYTLAENWEAVKALVAGANRVLGLVAVAAIAAILLRFWRRWRRRARG